MQTFVALPARSVYEGCKKTMADIEAAREKILRNAALKYQKRSWYLPDRSFGSALKLMPDAEKEVAAFHRADDMTKLRNIASLALAAMQQCEEFTMNVTAEAFSLIRRAYIGDVFET